GQSLEAVPEPLSDAVAVTLAPRPATRAVDVAEQDRLGFEDPEAEVLASPFMAPALPAGRTPPPLPTLAASPLLPMPSPSAGGHGGEVLPRARPATPVLAAAGPPPSDAAMSSMISEGASTFDSVFPPALLTSELGGGAPLDGRPQARPARWGWI